MALSAEEREALHLARAGDAMALQLLLRRHVAPLLAFARRLVHGDHHRAEDLAQETLLAACRGLAGFRGDAPVRTWLFRILVRLGNAPGRVVRGRVPKGTVEPAEVPDSFAPEPAHASLARELRARLDEALERLPARQRTALHLRAVEGMGYDAIAEVLGGTAGGARMLVLAARRTLRERLGDYLEDAP